ncbi:hypothetical protein FRC10_011690 [Ceratobasidium sp. 414]|nr:hypothetical protein FRC10_011690 [Ceratobasidium sp. 414]
MASESTMPVTKFPNLTERKASSGSVSIDEKDVNAFDKEEGSEVAQDLEIDSQQLDRLARLAEQVTDEEAEVVIHKVLNDHRHDPLYPNSVLDVAKRFLEDPNLHNNPTLYRKTLHEVKMEVALIIHDSPYAEVSLLAPDPSLTFELTRHPKVRTVVSPEDDPSTPCSTIQAWTIGLFFACAGAVINQLFSLRYPRIELITIMANVSFNVGYSSYVIVVQCVPTFFNQDWAKQFGYQITLSLSFQLIGYGLAGLSR